MSTPHKFDKLLGANIISGGTVGDGSSAAFEGFFAFMDDKFHDKSEHHVLHHANSAKGISFEPVVHTLVHKKDLQIGFSRGVDANVLRLTHSNFHETWAHGVCHGQNFCFTIYFDIEDLESKEGEKIVEKGYSKEYLQTLLAASPDRAREYANHNVLRVEGLLPWDDIKFVGFRYKPSDGSHFLFKYYKI